MIKFLLLAIGLDGAAWMYDPKIGGLMLFVLFIANFVFALNRTTS